MTESQLELQNQAKLHPAPFIIELTEDLKDMFLQAGRCQKEKGKKDGVLLSSPRLTSCLW